ncbi:MAG: FtsX-like permease family protein [Pseudolysinimonas sp.]
MRTSAARTWLRRAGRARAALTTIGATVFVLASAVGLTVGELDRSSAAGIQASLGSEAAALTVMAPRATNDAAQDAAIRREIAATFSGVPVTVTRSRVGTSDRWTIAPVASRIDASRLGALEHALRTIPARIEADGAAHSPAVRIAGNAVATVVSVRRGLSALGAISPVPEGVLALSGLIALVLACGSLTEGRRNETRLLRSRGATVRSIVGLDARESLIVCLTGAMLGVAVSLIANVVVFGSPPSPLAVALPALAVLAGALAISVVTSRRAALAAQGAPRESSGRRRAVASGTALAFAIVITAVATWRFESGAQSGTNFAQDPAAVLAPAALLCLVLILGLILAVRVAAFVEGRLALGRNVHVMLPLRDSARRVPVLVAPAVLLALAVSTATIAGSYGATWSRYLADSQLLTTGAPVHVAISGPALIEDPRELVDLEPYRLTDGVTSAVPVSREADQYSGTPVTVIGVRASELGRLLPSVSAVGDADAIAAALSPQAPTGIALGRGGSVTLTMSARATPDPLLVDPNSAQFDFDGSPIPQPPASTDPDTVLATLWLSDPLGSLVPVTLDAVNVSLTASSAPTDVQAELPTGGPWTIVALDARLEAPQAVIDFEFQVSRIRVAAAGASRTVELPSRGWTPLNSVFGDGTSTPVAGQPLSVSRVLVPPGDVGGLNVRLMPSRSTRVPLVVSRPFAQAYGLTVGRGVELDGAWSSFSGVVRRVVDLVPGTTSGASVIADLVALNAGRLRTSEQLQAMHEVWVGTGTPAAVATRLAAALPPARVTRADDARGTDFTRIAVAMLWTGAIGAIVFAWIAMGSAALAMLRRRRAEARVLRALGVRDSRRGRWRRAEFAGVGAIGILIGVFAGVVTTLVTVAPLARLATPTAPLFLTTRLTTDLAPIGLAAAVLAAGAAVLIAIYGRTVATEGLE